MSCSRCAADRRPQIRRLAINTAVVCLTVSVIVIIVLVAEIVRQSDSDTISKGSTETVGSAEYGGERHNVTVQLVRV